LATKHKHSLRVVFIGVAAHRNIHACSVWTITHLTKQPVVFEDGTCKEATVVDCPRRTKWFGKHFDVIFGGSIGLSFHMVVPRGRSSFHNHNNTGGTSSAVIPVRSVDDDVHPFPVAGLAPRIRLVVGCVVLIQRNHRHCMVLKFHRALSIHRYRQSIGFGIDSPPQRGG
jgi:hypothetical protein